jgi:hypothetical protein
VTAMAMAAESPHGSDDQREALARLEMLQAQVEAVRHDDARTIRESRARLRMLRARVEAQTMSDGRGDNGAVPPAR